MRALSGIMQALCGHYAGIMRALCGHYAGIKRHYAGIMQAAKHGFETPDVKEGLLEINVLC